MIELLQRLGYTPRYCVWELTLACNLRCQHCGSSAGERRPEELDLAACLDVADQLAEAGCEKVTLGGGEPTLHPSWDLVGRRLAERGVRVNMISNGWVWRDDHLRRARDAGLASVAFSLDGLEPDHDAVRRAGSFHRVRQAVERCVAAGFPVGVVTHINRRNCHSLAAQRDLLAGWGVAAWQLQLGIPSGAMCEHTELVVAPDDLLWLIPAIAALRAVMQRGGGPSIHVADNIGYYGRFEQAIRDHGPGLTFWVGCRAGCQAVGIESDGAVKGCLSLPSRPPFVEGSLRRRSLAQIWHDPRAFAFNRRFSEEQLGGFCAVCRYRDICRGGCAWTAYSHSANRSNNPYCFYRQAVLARRLELLDEVPTPAELGFEEGGGKKLIK